MKNLARVFGLQAKTEAAPSAEEVQQPRSLLEIAGVKAGDGKSTHSSYANWQGVLPIPPQSLILTTGSTSLEAWYVVAEAWAQTVLSYLPRGGSVLDIGCGCGKTARFLMLSEKVERYVGFDVISECIDWCKRYITPQSKERFSFIRADVYAYGYNDEASVQAKNYVFPAETDSMDVAFGASLFTHLSEEEIVRYLSESARVLKSGGYLLASIHTDPGDQKVKLGGATGSEHRTDIDPAYFLKLAKQLGFSEHFDHGLLCGQQTYALKR